MLKINTKSDHAAFNKKFS